MAGFEYEALARDGRTTRGILEGDSAKHVRALLREKGLSPVRVEAISDERAETQAPTLRVRGGLGSGQLALITRQFSTLLNSGLTIEESLNALIEQAETRRSRKVMAGVRAGVIGGLPLAESMAAFPSVFSPLYRTMVGAGEEAGRLDAVLASLADYLEDAEEQRQKVQLALIYPVLVSLVALAVVYGLLAYVVPQVARVFENANQALPLLTRMLIATSEFAQFYGLYVLALVVAATVAMKWSLRNSELRARWDGLLLRLPMFGRGLREISSARLAATLSILVQGGVPLLRALEAAKGVMTRAPMREAVELAERQVREGGSLSRSLRQSGRFPPMMLHLIQSGEKSGALGPMLARAASQQAREVERRIAALLALLEPVMILVMGGVVLVIVLAILMPIFEMNQMLR